MQASYSLKRLPLTLSMMGSLLLIALLLGGLTGYAIRGLVSQSAVTTAGRVVIPEAPALVRSSTAPDGEGQYVQGGRPLSVYAGLAVGGCRGELGSLPPTVYEQGGRPAIVYCMP